MKLEINGYEIWVTGGGEMSVRGAPSNFDWASVLRIPSWQAIAEIVFRDNDVDPASAITKLVPVKSAVREIEQILAEFRADHAQEYYAITGGGDWTIEEVRDFAIKYRNRKATQQAKRVVIARRRTDFDRQRDVLTLQLLDAGRPYVCVVPGCGVNIDLTIDHTLALSRGGSDELANLQFMCRPHNSEKGDRDPPGSGGT